MKEPYKQIQKELRAAGADGRELEELVAIAQDLRLLKDESQTNVARSALRRWLRRSAAFTVAAGVAAMVLSVVSQAALPTSRLYPVQEFSDAAAAAIHPAYRANIMMKRAGQVKQLVAQGTNSQTVLATLADYTREAYAYKNMPQANYAAFEVCNSDLEQAAAAAPPAVRRAINQSLAALET